VASLNLAGEFDGYWKNKIGKMIHDKNKWVRVAIAPDEINDLFHLVTEGAKLFEQDSMYLEFTGITSLVYPPKKEEASEIITG
jgi:hypothetical protein